MIAEILASYAAACERSTIENRPTVWAIHFDIWNEKRGEIGLGHGEPATAAFTALIPFVLVPEIGTSILVLDLSGLKHRELAITELIIDKTESKVHHCRVPFGIGDGGSMDFGNVKDQGSPYVPAQVLATLTTVIDARRDRFGWDESFSFEAATRVAAEFVKQLAV